MLASDASVTIALIAAISSFAASFLAAIVGLLNNQLARKHEMSLRETKAAVVETKIATVATKDDLAATKAAVVMLEKNTNDKMDKLLTAKDELRESSNAAARAEGLTAGRAETAQGQLP